jgi:hypothetical protein
MCHIFGIGEYERSASKGANLVSVLAWPWPCEEDSLAPVYVVWDGIHNVIGPSKARLLPHTQVQLFLL